MFFKASAVVKKVKSGLVAMRLMSGSEWRSSRHYFVTCPIKKHFAAALADMTHGKIVLYFTVSFSDKFVGSWQIHIYIGFYKFAF